MGDSIAERIDAGWQAARHWETECEAARAERDALQAQLATLKKRVADAPKTHAQVQHTACWVDEIVPQEGLYALVRLEDGE